MKNTIKIALKSIFVVVLFCTYAFADGDMGNGGKTCINGNCPISNGFAAPSLLYTQGGADVFVFDDAADAAIERVTEMLAQAGLL